MNWTTATSLTTLIVFLLFQGSLIAAVSESRQTDSSLFEDLGIDLLGPLPLDRGLLRDLGEDTGQSSDDAKDDWLVRVVQHMQEAQWLLERQGETGQASSAQEQAIAGLDAMITELAQRKSQCSGGQSKQSSQPKPGASKPGKPGTSPATGASPTTSQNGDLAASLETTSELVKDLWGHLPERQRQQILQPLSEDFLPKYSTEIEEYFRALADPDRRPPESP